MPGVVLYREGSDATLTIAAAEAVADGPGWRLRFREITTRDQADALRGAYLEAVVRPEEDLARGTYYWHEVVGTTVRGVDGEELGTVRDIYRVGETEVYVVDGGPYGSFDVPAIRAFIRIFAPRRGEIVVDAASLDLRVPRSKAPDPDRPKAPRRTTRRKNPSPATPDAGIAAGPDLVTPAPAPDADPDAPADGRDPTQP